MGWGIIPHPIDDNNKGNNMRKEINNAYKDIEIRTFRKDIKVFNRTIYRWYYEIEYTDRKGNLSYTEHLCLSKSNANYLFNKMRDALVKYYNGIETKWEDSKAGGKLTQFWHKDFYKEDKDTVFGFSSK